MVATAALTVPRTPFPGLIDARKGHLRSQFIQLQVCCRFNRSETGIGEIGDCNRRTSPFTSARHRPERFLCVPLASLSSSSSSSPKTSTKLYVSGLSFRTTEESLRNAFRNFGQLLEVNLVMDKIAKRPRGFAFLRYATDEEAQNAINGMHGKFLDGRVIFVEIAKPRSELRQGFKRNSRQ